MKRLALVIVFTIGLLAGALLTLPKADAAGRHCRFTYVVRPKDTLSSIAARAGTNVWYLARINRIRNINYIYDGQMLCLPNPIVQSQPEESSLSSLNLVVEYTFDPNADPEASRWTLGRDGHAGLRLSYPMNSGQFIEMYTDTAKLRGASISSSPLFWLVPTSADSTDYILVAIGDAQPLLALQMEMTPTQNITDIIPPPDPADLEAGDCPQTRQPVGELSVSGNNQVRLHAELMEGNGIFIPVTITEIDYHETVERAASCYRDIGFALHPNDSPQVDGYRLLIFLKENIGGPPTGGSRRCQNWGGSGWWSRWRRTFFRC